MADLASYMTQLNSKNQCNLIHTTRNKHVSNTFDFDDISSIFCITDLKALKSMVEHRCCSLASPVKWSALDMCLLFRTCCIVTAAVTHHWPASLKPPASLKKDYKSLPEWFGFKGQVEYINDVPGGDQSTLVCQTRQGVNGPFILTLRSRLHRIIR